MEKDVGEDELDQHEEDVEDLQVVMDKERLKPVRQGKEEERQTEADWMHQDEQHDKSLMIINIMIRTKFVTI